MNPEWKNRYELAIDAARQAGKLALQYYPDADSAAFARSIEWKEDMSPVTRADREAEHHLRTTLLGAFPADGFLGEESGDTPGSSGFRWIIDPVDGTRSFVRGIPLWGTLVGLEYQQECIAGVICVPCFDHTYHALRGAGAFRDNQKIHVSNVDQLHKSLIFYSGINWFARAGKWDGFWNLAMKCDRQRGLGDFYGFVLVAQGSGELMVDHGVHIWDVAAIKPLIEEAGGRFSDWDGQPRVDRIDCVASNGLLHEEALRLLNEV
ncbi:MAG: inositol monophosphatase [Gemmataceae bacterium]